MPRRPALTLVPDPGAIQIRGARQNNLKGFDLDLPLNKLIVVSGPSGSGKSSLAFDTVYAEGQRRYVETFSPYTRQFFERMDKPQVEEIRGIPPAIAIEQANNVRTSRSTVGTMTELNDYLKLIFPRLARGFCPSCEREVRPDTPSAIARHIMELKASHALLTFGVPVPTGTKPAEFFDFIQKQGYLRVWLDGAVVRTDTEELPKRLPGLVEVVQDRIALLPENATRLAEALETALRLGNGRVIARVGEASEAHPFSTGWHCAHCDIDIAAPSPSLFSFNNAVGACPECKGFGRVIGIDLERAIPDRSLSIAQGVVKPFQTENGKECQRDLLKGCAAKEIDIKLPFEELPRADQEFVLNGEDRHADAEELWKNGRWYGVRGFFQWLESKSYKMHVRVLLSRYRNYTTCPRCNGGRYQPATLNYRVRNRTLPQWMVLSIDDFLSEMRAELEALDTSDHTVELLGTEILARLRYLVEVGVGYLSLDRTTRSLSGGEVQRVNLTTCLGASLVNTLFVLDEPSVGLHPRDIARLVRVMHGLRDKGNTLLVVEHEEAVLRAADHFVELGPGRGDLGGELVFTGPANEARGTLTADYLQGTKSIPLPKKRRTPKQWISVQGAKEHNLDGLDVRFPLGVFTCVTGVSGSGKSTLVHDVLHANLARIKGLAHDGEPGRCKRITGADAVGDVVMVDQSPLSKTPRSSVALYLGIFDAIREAFAMLPESLAQGLTASSFSFNTGTGRCTRCGGNGFEKIEMQFLSDVFVRCPECEGRRFQPHILKIRLAGKSVHDVLELTVDAAIEFFAADPRITRPLVTLQETGLGYLRLGQSLNVLSGGESQRLKLVAQLGESQAGNRLLLLDEPTTGLHFDDIAMLLKVFQKLVEAGNSLLVIEHNMEVIKCADWVIDLGPEAGVGGGKVVAEGTPEKVAAVRESHTGRFLRRCLGLKESAVDVAQREAEILRVAEAAPKLPSGNNIIVRGAREHNLKNISLTIPRDEMVVITGLSGSGKSTLAFDILFAEGQRRFLDSMSAYARQFAEQLEKPDVDVISGLPPTVAIEQRVTRGGGKSTVATVTEIYHFVRLLFAKTGVQHCPRCQMPVEKQTIGAIVQKAQTLAKKGGVRVLAPIVKARKGFHTEVARWAIRQGFEEMLVDGKWENARRFPKLERFREHTIDVLVGERKGAERLQTLIERALEVGRGTIRIVDNKNKLTVMSTEMSCPTCGDSFEELDPRLFSFNSPHGCCPQCKGFGETWHPWNLNGAESELEKEIEEERQHETLDASEAMPCTACKGSRLNPVARNVRLQGLTISDFTHLTAADAVKQLGKLSFQGTQKQVVKDLIPEIRQRLEFMGTVGLGYLVLDRSAKTLSGGESQRIRLAAQLGSTLRGVLYVLDEPTIGLHPRDNDALLDTLEKLQQKGNSLVIVEHDDETMRRAKTIIDLGPGAGSRGGEVVARGTLEEIRQNPNSVTGRALREPLQHPSRGERRSLDTVEQHLVIRGARANNLKEIDCAIPLGRFTVLTGVSGSGKSTLMRQVLGPAVVEEKARKPKVVAKTAKKKKKADELDVAVSRGPWDAVEGIEHVETVYEVDQSPIGKTSRSTPATYIKVFDEIRKLFAQMPAARMRGYSPSRFSFNTEGGRCEACAGQGVIKVEMNFLPASYIPCTDCHGKRYNPATLEVLYQERSIGDVMDMTLEQAATFFAAQPAIRRPLQLLCDTGLGYLKLGQPSPTLSGGEAQRIKLVSELVRGVARAETDLLRRQRKTKSILYLLEEPTIGLHMADVAEMLKVIHRLVDGGHTVVMIEHNMDVIADADYIIDIGPEAGDGGGEIVASGTPEEIVKSKRSRTAPFLRARLALR